ncbi:MAG: helix-turn-helix transcriptional regulator [Alphaproteobacteria bacterium]|nr:helix-turn-helix transcriptional regulator [Alphaproteobacteria bacterium]
MATSKEVELTARPGGGAIDLQDLKRKSWPSVMAQFMRIAAPSTFDFKLASTSNYIALHDIYRSDGTTTVPGLPRSYQKDLRNKITFIPAGCPVEGWSVIDRPGAFVALYIDRSSSGDDVPDLAKLSPQICFDDPMLRLALSHFQLMLHGQMQDMPGYAESLGILVSYEMKRVASKQVPVVRHQGGLTARQMRIVADYIESHLLEQTSVSELAALLDLTRFHFMRAFKQTMGVPPHRFMIQRRIERAKDLLADVDISIGDVAARSGFNSITQLTRAFRRVNGTTPSAFRRNMT